MSEDSARIEHLKRVLQHIEKQHSEAREDNERRDLGRQATKCAMEIVRIGGSR